MIQRVSIENWKGIQNLSLDLARLSVIVGPNASGKTSILQAIHALTQLVAHPLQKVFNGATSLDEIVRRGCTSTTLMASGSPADPAQEPLEWRAERARSGEWTPTKREGWLDKRSHDASPLAKEISSAVYLQLDVAALKRPSAEVELQPVLAGDGGNLAAVLEDLAVNDAEARSALVESVRAIVPTFKQFRLERALVEETLLGFAPLSDGSIQEKPIRRTVLGRRLRLDLLGASQIDAAQASEGTLLALALLTALHQPRRPRLLLVDDVDRGLHPKAQLALVGLLKKILDGDPGLQILTTTHSPYVLDALDPRQVFVTDLRDDGSVACARLDRHPDFPRWKEKMTAGEFWSHVGESWVRDLAPEPTRT